MINLSVPLSILIIHTIGDFLFQSDWMAINKSKNWKALGLHVSVYSLCFVYWGLPFVAITFLTHFLTDAVTSRITSKLWFFTPLDVHYTMNSNQYRQLWVSKGGNRHWFFVTIGIDQLIHFITLALTYKLVGG